MNSKAKPMNLNVSSTIRTNQDVPFWAIWNLGVAIYFIFQSTQREQIVNLMKMEYSSEFYLPIQKYFPLLIF